MNRSFWRQPAPFRVLLAAAATIAATLALTGCGAAGDILAAAMEDAESSKPEIRDEESGEIVTGGVTDVFQLRIGDCLNDPGAEEVLEVVTVPCAEPHDYEVYHHAELDDGEYPTNLDDLANEICAAAFTGFIGIPIEESSLGFTHYTPTLMSWLHDNDRAVDCMVYDEGLTSGSLAGAAR